MSNLVQMGYQLRCFLVLEVREAARGNHRNQKPRSMSIIRGTRPS